MMKTKDLFLKITSERGWYKTLNISKQVAHSYRKRAERGEMSEGKMYEYLLKLGYKYKWFK
jgi:hypothetical protein